MRQRTFHLEEAAANALNAAYLHCTDTNTKTRYQAVRLYGLGYSTKQVQDICGYSRCSLMNWTRDYQDQGLTAKAVLEANLRLEVLWFPPGCPELNRVSTRSEGHRSMSGKRHEKRSGTIINVQRCPF